MCPTRSLGEPNQFLIVTGVTRAEYRAISGSHWGIARVSSARSLHQQDCLWTALGTEGLESSTRPFQDFLVYRWKHLPLGLWALRIAGRLWLCRGSFQDLRKCQWTVAGTGWSSVTRSFQNLQPDWVWWAHLLGLPGGAKMSGAGSWVTLRSVCLLPNAWEGVTPSLLSVYDAGDKTKAKWSCFQIGTAVDKSTTCMQT